MIIKTFTLITLDNKYYPNYYQPHINSAEIKYTNNKKETTERPFLIGTEVYNIQDVYLKETAGYGGKIKLLPKGSKSVIKKYHYNNEMYIALGDFQNYYNIAWTNELNKFTTDKNK